MQGFLFLWVVFLILTAEIARFGQPFSLTRAPYGSRIAASSSFGPLQGAGNESGRLVATWPIGDREKMPWGRRKELEARAPRTAWSDGGAGVIALEKAQTEEVPTASSRKAAP
jgi:hypothetical protein